MSYVRWSSVIGSDYTFEEMMEDIKNKTLASKDMTKRQLETPGSYKSEWYIFWHCGFDESENQTREDQCLAMYLQGEKVSPVLPYDDVKEMFDNDDWSMLGYSEIRQKEVLVDCVKQWLEDVEEEYGE